MLLRCISCGIFRFELEHILPAVSAALGCAVSAKYLNPGLDAQAEALEKAVTRHLAEGPKDSTALLYGSMCHTEWPRITGPFGAAYPRPANCAEMILSPERKKEIDAAANVYYLTMGGLKLWKTIYQDNHGWDSFTARQKFCYFEKIIVLDTGVFPIVDEMLFDFFEFTGIPVEVEKISLDHFTRVVTGLCQTQLKKRGLASRGGPVPLSSETRGLSV